MRKDRPCILKTEDITMQFGGVRQQLLHGRI